MKIVIKEGGQSRFNLRLPTGLLLNRFTAYLAPVLNKDKDSIPYNGSQLYALIKTLKDYKKAHPEWVLLEVDSSSGEHVEIRL